MFHASFPDTWCVSMVFEQTWPWNPVITFKVKSGGITIKVRLTQRTTLFAHPSHSLNLGMRYEVEWRGCIWNSRAAH